MSKQIRPEDAAQLLANFQVPPGNSAAPPAPTPFEQNPQRVFSSITEELQYEQLMELRQRRLAREEQERMQRVARENNIKSVAVKMQKEGARRAACPHRKPNNRPAVAGMRDHNHNFHFICQYCQQEWTNNELPLGLQIDMDTVGGPA